MSFKLNTVAATNTLRKVLALLSEGINSFSSTSCLLHLILLPRYLHNCGVTTNLAGASRRLFEINSAPVSNCETKKKREKKELTIDSEARYVIYSVFSNGSCFLSTFVDSFCTYISLYHKL